MWKLFTALLLLCSGPSGGTAQPETAHSEALEVQQDGQAETPEPFNRNEVERSLWKSADTIRSTLSLELMASYYGNNRIHVVLRPVGGVGEVWNPEETVRIKKTLNTILSSENLPLTVEPYDPAKSISGNVAEIYPDRQTLSLSHSAFLLKPIYGDAVEVHITGDTVFKNTDTGQSIRYKDLEPGMTADIWADEAKLLGGSPELHAVEIRVHKRSALELTKAPLTEVFNTDFGGITRIEIRYGDGKQLTIEDPEQIKAITDKLRAIQVSISYDQMLRVGYSYGMKLYQEDSKEPAFIFGSTFMKDHILLDPGAEGLELDHYMVELGRKTIPNLLPGSYPDIEGIWQ